ncbi:MAG: hypothetical protein ACRD17_10180, partial [Terriglobales bacterium]
ARPRPKNAAYGPQYWCEAQVWWLAAGGPAARAPRESDFFSSLFSLPGGDGQKAAGRPAEFHDLARRLCPPGKGRDPSDMTAEACNMTPCDDSRARFSSLF